MSGLGNGVVAIAAGQFYTCAVTTAGAVTCWGDNTDGQLGDGTTTQRDTPVAVLGLISGVTTIAAGEAGEQTCALTAAGAIACWGSNAFGQLGNGATTDQHRPVFILAAQSISFNASHTAGIGTLTLSATASSGLPVTFDTCSVSGNSVTIHVEGLCGVRASQPGGNDGGGSVAAASQQLRLILVGDMIFSDGFE